MGGDRVVEGDREERNYIFDLCFLLIRSNFLFPLQMDSLPLRPRLRISARCNRESDLFLCGNVHEGGQDWLY